MQTDLLLIWHSEKVPIFKINKKMFTFSISIFKFVKSVRSNWQLLLPHAAF